MKLPVFMVAALAAFAADAAEDQLPRKDVTVGILIFDGVQIIDFAAPYEVFGQAGYTIKTVSANGKPVTTVMGLKVTPDLSFADATGFDVVLVPGGNVHDVVKDEPTSQWLRARAAQADITMSVCTGSHILAASRLLDNLKATTFHNAFDDLAAASPTTTVVRDARWVDNGKIITSAGLSSGIDAALHVVERLSGQDHARTIALHLEYEWPRAQGFIRGAMADRYIVQRPIQWPHGTQLARAFAYGDESHWMERFRVTATAPAGDHLQAIAKNYDQRLGWSIQKASATELLLRRKSEQGGDVTMRITAVPLPEPKTFNLDVWIDVTE